MFIASRYVFKSLKPIHPPVELPNFVVLSGLNGAGKSHLLTAISQNHVSLTENNQALQPIKLADHNTLAPNNSVIVSYETIRQSSQNALNIFNNYKSHKSNPAYSNYKIESVIGDATQIKIINKIAQAARKKIDDLKDDDFFRHYPIEEGLEQTDVFHQNFSTLFKRYHVKQVENDFNEFLNQKHGGKSFLTDEEFKEQYGDPPWLFVNKIIKEANLDYHINSPQQQHRDAPFELKLINDLTGAEVSFGDLSSGEKVIMSLALSLYNSKFDVEFPKVLLMDEPDSHLHPSMTKQFLDVMQNVFVGEKGVKVIMTTHSPSTVALAPEESLFVMNKTEPRVTKTTKDKALRILTSGVPTLSISYENRRQVFVESKHDVYFYEKVYERLKDSLVSEVSINFMSSGTEGQGSCDQVKEVVNKLTSYGNRSVYGIIDWDQRNAGNEFVKVLGRGRRYSVENYIFDPVLLATYLSREKFIDRRSLGLDDRDRYIDFSGFEEAKLQAIADIIVSRVQAKLGHSPGSTPNEVEYVSGKKITLPSWFLQMQGHQLESIVKDTFPELKRFQREGELKREIINKVIDDVPDLISKDVLTILSEIQDLQSQ